MSETLGSLAYLVRAKKGDGLEVASTNQLDAEEPVQHKRHFDTTDEDRKLADSQVHYILR